MESVSRVEYKGNPEVLIMRLINNKIMIFISLVLCDIIAEEIAKNLE